jgi:hypothetical protein
MRMSNLIWLDHLEDLTRAALALQTAVNEINKHPTNYSDLIFELPEVLATVTLDGDPTVWSLVLVDDSVYLRTSSNKEDENA